MRIYIPPGVSNLLGPVFKRAREQARPKLTQADLAARITTLGLQMDRSTVSRIENQERGINDIELHYFMKALPISPYRLYQMVFSYPNVIPLYPEVEEDGDLEILVAEDDLEDPEGY